jgi:hypothetical protein
MLKILLSIVLGVCGLTGNLLAQSAPINFKNRQAIVINNAPTQIELSGFRFENEYRQSRDRLVTNLSWKNTAATPITAFEIVILRYDPFNRPIRGGGRWMITGHNSANWSALMPGESSSDGLIGFDSDAVMTSIVYVRAIRFEDGSVWNADISFVERAIRQQLPVLKELGTVSPPLTEDKKH